MLKFNMVSELSMWRPSKRQIAVVFLDLGIFCRLDSGLVAEMDTNIFILEEKLQGSANYNSWKARLTTILEENDLDDMVFNTIEEPTSYSNRTIFKKKQAKARRIIYDSIKETLMPNFTSLKHAKECFDNLTNFYEMKAPSQKRVLKIRLRTLKMNKDEGVGPFFTKIA